MTWLASGGGFRGEKFSWEESSPWYRDTKDLRTRHLQGTWLSPRVAVTGCQDRVSVQDRTPWLPDVAVAHTEIQALRLKAGEGPQLPAAPG